MLKSDMRKKAVEYIREADKHLKEGNTITSTAYSLQALAYICAMKEDMSSYGEFMRERAETRHERR